MYANMNLLKDDECATLIKECDACQGMTVDQKYEFCAGKKHEFPPSMMSFVRKKKKKAEVEQEIADAKRFKTAAPGKFYYKIKRKSTRVSLGTRESYPYDWFIGGVDSCQGDSGGPMHKNEKVLVGV